MWVMIVVEDQQITMIGQNLIPDKINKIRETMRIANHPKQGTVPEIVELVIFVASPVILPEIVIAGSGRIATKQGV